MATTSLDKGKIKVLLLEGIDSTAIDTLRGDGYSNIESHKTSLAGAELRERLRDAHLLGIRSRTQLPKDVLAAAERLIAIGCFCIGTDQVDTEAARERGVPVFNAPFSNTRSVAELVIGEIIMLCRGIPQRNAAAHRGVWMKSVAGAVEVRGKTLGIVGYGHIGTEVGVKLVKYSDNGSTLTAVNFPEVSLPEHRGKHRLLHIHRNQPGVLARINGILSESKINVSSEYLETNGSIGYAVIDVDGSDRPLSLAIRGQ